MSIFEICNIVRLVTLRQFLSFGRQQGALLENLHCDPQTCDAVGNHPLQYIMLASVTGCSYGNEKRRTNC